MKPEEKARLLADLEASLTSELAGLRTLQVALVNAAHPRDIQPLVTGWLEDWTEYHTSNTRPLIAKALRVAVSEVSPGHLTDAVWALHKQSFVPDLDVAATEATIPPHNPVHKVGNTSALVLVPRAPSLKKPSVITVAGQPRTVPAAVAKVLTEVAAGAQIAQMRPDTFRALVEGVPELASLFKRDPRKMVAKRAFWTVTGGAEAVKFGP